MITIKESCPPRKLSGRSSVLVSFPYNEQLINEIKTFSPAVYHKKTAEWEVSSCQLSKLLDRLTYFDDIKFIAAEEETKAAEISDLTEAEIKQFKYTPFAHQIDGINFLLAKKKALLLDAPGCGKTLTAMYFAEALHKRKLIDHCLIVVGFSSLKQNWKKEIKKFSNESVVVIGEKISRSGTVSYTTLPERAKQLKNPISEFFVVINIEVLRDKKIVEAIAKSANNFGLVVVDEIHKCAGTGSDQFAGLKKLGAPYKVGLTGSLITNNPISAFGPLSWTENDFATLTNFKAQYCKFGGFNNAQIIGYKNLDLLRDELESCSLRRTFDMISASLPDKIIDVETVEMSEAHRKFYESIKQGIKEEADKIELNTNNLLALTTRLRQAASAPTALSSAPPDCSKILRCVDLVDELISQNEKVVILANFRDSVYDLANRLAKYKPVVNTGDQTEYQVSENVDRFQNDEDCKVFIGTHSRAGTGITLNAAKYMLMIDTPWTYANFDQSACRIYRINNTSSAYIKVLCEADTIDERIWEIVETKKELGDYLVDGKENTSFTASMRSIIAAL